MNYQQTIDYLYNTLPMFSRMGSAAFKKDLTNIRLLCERLDNPQAKFKSIHVAGTNGKGSVSHMLAAVFQTSGYKTGLYTSPHLYDFRERIRINGDMVNEAFVIDFVERIQPLMQEIEPSFFEITVAMAFDYFARQKVDMAIVEVGLGGRLDSTNIISPVMSVITNIGWDHMNMLGNTLEEIAFEKAGIIKKGTPVVIGEALPQTKKVFDQMAAKRQAPLVYAEDCFTEVGHVLHEDRIELHFIDREENPRDLSVDLPGIYQVKNTRTVLAAVQQLQQKGFLLEKETVVKALKKVKRLTGLSGRWELIHQDPKVVLEVAHNQNGMEQMLLHLEEMSFNRLHLIMGMVKDKEIENVLKLLPKKAAYYFTQAHIPRALDAASLANAAAAFSLKGRSYTDVNLALKDALSIASKNDLIVVCGSIFLVSEVKRKEIRQRVAEKDTGNTA